MKESREKLGARPTLVMHKLGFELRSCLSDTISAPLPTRLQALCDELLGYGQWRDVTDDRKGQAHNR
jgi:hypothetical protein